MVTGRKKAMLHHTDEGSGQTLVLLHGFTEHSGIWDEYARKLRTMFRVIRIDLPGHGLSPSMGRIYSMEMMADEVRTVLSNLRIRKCVMIGHSMGGYVTLSFAARYPAMLRGFGLFHSQADADSEEAKEGRDRTIGIIRANHSNWLNQFIPDLFAPHNREKYGSQIAALQAAADRIRPSCLIACLEGMKRRASRLDVLSGARVPVLFIAGKLDERIPIGKVTEQASLVQHAELLILSNVAHMGYLEASESCYLFLRNFATNCYQLSSASHSA